jgi:hypothetical protein
MGGVEIEDCVTMAQFNELKQSVEDKQDQLPQEALKAEIREHRQPRDNANASHHEDEVDETKEETAARLAREQQRRRE